MKNKGRKHKVGNAYGENGFNGIGNSKGSLVAITRDIHKMNGRSPFMETGVSKKYTKQKWSKRVRGYFKSQTKDLLSFEF